MSNFRNKTTITTTTCPLLYDLYYIKYNNNNNNNSKNKNK